MKKVIFDILFQGVKRRELSNTFNEGILQSDRRHYKRAVIKVGYTYERDV